MSPEATIAVVIDDQDTRSSMAADLAQRYAAHYRIIELEAAAVSAFLADVTVLAAVITTVELEGDIRGVALANRFKDVFVAVGQAGIAKLEFGF